MTLELNRQNYKQELLDKAQAWCKLTGGKLSGLGRIIMNDGAFFTRLKDDRIGCRIETYFKIKDWFHKNMPKTKS
jgi:hypothetical protein